MPGRNIELVMPGAEDILPPTGDIGRELGGVEVLEVVDANREETAGEDRR